MKDLMMIVSIATVLLIASCSEKGTHTHDDGSVHKAHTETQALTPAAKQETFKVDVATQQEVKSKEEEHKHDDDHGHNHDNGSEHKH